MWFCWLGVGGPTKTVHTLPRQGNPALLCDATNDSYGNSRNWTCISITTAQNPATLFFIRFNGDVILLTMKLMSLAFVLKARFQGQALVKTQKLETVSQQWYGWNLLSTSINFDICGLTAHLHHINSRWMFSQITSVSFLVYTVLCGVVGHWQLRGVVPKLEEC